MSHLPQTHSQFPPGSPVPHVDFLLLLNQSQYAHLFNKVSFFVNCTFPTLPSTLLNVSPILFCAFLLDDFSFSNLLNSSFIARLVAYIHRVFFKKTNEKQFYLKKFFFYFLERGKRGRETLMCERNMDQLHLAHPQPWIWPATQAHALTGDQTCNPLVHRPVLNPLSHISQDKNSFFLNVNNVFTWLKNSKLYEMHQMKKISFIHFLLLHLFLPPNTDRHTQRYTQVTTFFFTMHF